MPAAKPAHCLPNGSLLDPEIQVDAACGEEEFEQRVQMQRPGSAPCVAGAVGGFFPHLQHDGIMQADRDRFVPPIKHKDAAYLRFEPTDGAARTTDSSISTTLSPHPVSDDVKELLSTRLTYSRNTGRLTFARPVYMCINMHI